MRLRPRAMLRRLKAATAKPEMVGKLSADERRALKSIRLGRTGEQKARAKLASRGLVTSAIGSRCVCTVLGLEVLDKLAAPNTPAPDRGE